jgi:ketosteroid isomerase-like protein
MTFDALAAAIDWLEAYRAGDIDAILEMFADDAVVECGCTGLKTITGREGLRRYWEERLKNSPATDLDDLQPSSDGATISYLTPNGVINATLEFDANGRITLLQCGPSN